MKKITLIFSALLLFSLYSNSQILESDIKFVQDVFGMEKTAMVKQYMNLTPQQDSLFYPDYNAYCIFR